MPTGIEQRIPSLSDEELESLHANAVRLAQSGTPVQRGQAEELLPLLGAALEERRATHAASKARARAALKRAAPPAPSADAKETTNEPD